MTLKLCILLLCASAAQAVGESCRVQGQAGVCAPLIECEALMNERQSGRLAHEQICGFEGSIYIVCCLEGISTTTARPIATTSRLGTTTTEYIPPVYDYQPNIPTVEACAPLRPDQTAEKTGRKAWDNCIDYHEQLVRPCERSVSLLGGLVRADNCKHNDEVFVGSSSVLRDEVPHMALLGYELSNGSMYWHYSGTLLSDQYVLIAAHCKFRGISSRKAYVVVGSRKSTDNIDSPQIHRMQRVIRHPLYKKGSRYHDIALIMTETRIILDQWTVPACLDVFGGDYSKAIVLSRLRSKADIVKKVSLNQLTIKQCQKLPRRRGLEFGLNTTTQICYEDTSFSNTYQRDTGGPLVIKNPRIHCMYSVVGVTSFFKRWKSKISGVFTKVAHYVPWIESVVWP